MYTVIAPFVMPRRVCHFPYMTGAFGARHLGCANPVKPDGCVTENSMTRLNLCCEAQKLVRINARDSRNTDE